MIHVQLVHADTSLWSVSMYHVDKGMHLHPFAFSILTNKYSHWLNAFRLLRCFADVLLSWAPHICKGWSAKPGCCAAVHLTSESEFVQAIYDAETTCDLARGCVKFNPPGNWCKSLQIEGWSYKEKLSCLVLSRYEYALSSQPFERGQAESMTNTITSRMHGKYQSPTKTLSWCKCMHLLIWTMLTACTY